VRTHTNRCAHPCNLTKNYVAKHTLISTVGFLLCFNAPNIDVLAICFT